jgi:hypothetical protein
MLIRGVHAWRKKNRIKTTVCRLDRLNVSLAFFGLMTDGISRTWSLYDPVAEDGQFSVQ